MKKNRPSILIITSLDPHIGPAVVAEDFYKTFKRGGYEVDMLTPFPVEGHPEYLSVYNNYKEWKYSPTRLLWRLNDVLRKVGELKHGVSSYMFFYRRETMPPMSINDILKSIKKNYDVVYVVFWQRMLTFKTIEAIYDKLKCLIYFCCADYSPMSGGCHFTGECKRFETGCGCCPGIWSNNEKDFTRFNIEYRKKVYKKVHPVVTGNGYMHTFFKRSYLLKDYDRLMKKYFNLDLDEYKEYDRDKAKKYFNIPLDKKFLLFFGSQSLNDKRKGINYLLNALDILYSKLSDRERNLILLVLAGRDIEEIKNRLCFDYRYLGYLNSKELIMAYSMSDIFLSPSVDDAGPSMVNQSLACGTPVVAFEMGTALDYIKGHNTGYCAKLKDVTDFAKGIEKIYRMPKEDYMNMRLDCREISEKQSSDDCFLKIFHETYERYTLNDKNDDKNDSQCS